MMQRSKGIFILLLLALVAAGCSTTRTLKEGEYRLAKNTIKVDRRGVDNSELNPYLRQKPNSSIIFGWNPFLSIYGWAGNSDSKFANFLRKLGQAPVVFDESQVDASVVNLRNHLEYIGWYGSDVTADVTKKGRRAYVTYNVTLGKRYKISEINYNVPSYGTFTRDFNVNNSRSTVKVGSWLSESALEDETVRSAQFFRDIGYYGFTKAYYSFEADTLGQDGNAILTMSILDYPRSGTPQEAMEHRKYTIGDVTISYPESVPFRSSVLENLNILKPGQLYSERRVNMTYNRLSNLTLFNGINIDIQPAGEDKVDCNINLRNSGLQGFKINFEGSVNSTGLLGLSPQVSYYHKNLFHGGELLNVSIKGNHQFRLDSDVKSNEISTSASIRFPKFVGLPNRIFRGNNIPRTDVSLAFSYQDRPEYARTIISSAFGYTGTLGRGRRFSYQLYPLQANVVRLFNISSDFAKSIATDRFMMNAYSDHFDMGIGAIAYYTTDVSAVPAGSYHYYRLMLDLSGNAISLLNPLLPTNDQGQHTIWQTPYSQYVRSEVQLGRTIRTGNKDQYAIAARFLAGVGYAYGNASTLPFEKQFYSGGASSMRGWQARTIGPGHSQINDIFVIPSQTGDLKLEANLEFRAPLFWKVEGALFADAGNIWALNGAAPEEERFALSSIAGDWGIGLRVNLDFILVRVDMGMQVHDPARAEGDRWLGPTQWLRRGNYAIHFGVGYPF